MVPSHSSSLLHTAAAEQDIIGWHNFFVGRLSKKWAQVQQIYYNSKYSHPNDFHGKNGLSRFIPRIYDTVYAVWMYRNSVVLEMVEERLN